VVEVIIRGQPGAYVGLSGVDAAFYSMQAGNEISYGEVIIYSLVKPWSCLVLSEVEQITIPLITIALFYQVEPLLFFSHPSA
jgi:hypothetical protein